MKMGLWFFHFLGIYPNGVTVECHISYLKNIHLQIVGIQTQSKIKIQNNLVIDMRACYCGHDFVSFNNVDCRSCNTQHNFIY
jgi:hypothetical protein